MLPKQKYREFCKEEKNIPIFSRDWWLDAVCGEEDWDAVVVEKDEKVIAVMPYYKVKRAVFDCIVMPKLTQTMGPYIKYPINQKYEDRMSYEKRVMDTIIERLPDFISFSQNFHYSVTNWLPFYWRGFQQTTRYTYVIESLSNLEMTWRDLKENIRQDIRKAAKKVSVFYDDGVEKFYEINLMTFKRQNIKIPYSMEFLKIIDAACEARKCRRIYFAKDNDGRIHAAIYIVWDENSAYCLAGGGDPSLRHSGATSLLLWEAIKYAYRVTKRFDFEGSMIKSIETFFSAFGARQTPYFAVTKINNSIARIITSGYSFLRRLHKKLMENKCRE